MVLGWDPPKTGLWVLGYEAGIYKTGTRLKSLPDWYWVSATSLKKVKVPA